MAHRNRNLKQMKHTAILYPDFLFMKDLQNIRRQMKKGAEKEPKRSQKKEPKEHR
jgi:hypothetical protein